MKRIVIIGITLLLIALFLIYGIDIIGSSHRIQQEPLGFITHTVLNPTNHNKFFHQKIELQQYEGMSYSEIVAAKSPQKICSFTSDPYDCIRDLAVIQSNKSYCTLLSEPDSYGITCEEYYDQQQQNFQEQIRDCQETKNCINKTYIALILNATTAKTAYGIEVYSLPDCSSVDCAINHILHERKFKTITPERIGAKWWFKFVPGYGELKIMFEESFISDSHFQLRALTPYKNISIATTNQTNINTNTTDTALSRKE